MTYRRIFWFWLPLAGTWLMMAAEGPYLAALVARLDEPAVNLAAFGVTFAFAIIIESPVIMLMSASTALVRDAESFRALRRFGYVLAAGLSGLQLLLLTPALFFPVADALALPDDVARLVRGGLFIMLPWPAAIGYRRFHQGLLITAHLTRRVAYGTALRLLSMSVTAALAYAYSTLPGAHIGALALSVAVVVEAVASRMMTARLIPGLLGRCRAAGADPPLRLRVLTAYYLPLALTSVLALASQPLVTFFMGQARFPLESLAVLPVLHGLTFIFRAVGLSYLEVVIALAGSRREHVGPVARFAALLGVGSALVLALIAFTPLSTVWFRDVSGLDTTLTDFAQTPLRVLAILPALSVLLAFERGLLVHARRNTAITWATMVELTALAGILALGVHVLDLPGAVAAAAAIIGARVVGNAWLVPTCLSVLRSARTSPADPEPGGTAPAPA